MKHTVKKEAREVSLELFCLSLATQYIKDKTSIDGALMAELTRRLIAHESQPGGPYFGPNHTLDFSTNLAIGYLFACFNTPLPNVTRFIQHRRTAAPHSAKQLLYAYDQLGGRVPKKLPPAPSEHLAIFASVKKQLNQLQQPEKAAALAFLHKIHQADTSFEIALLPTFFANSLISKPSSPLPLYLLGQANIYCWIAYSIYDKLLDDEPAVKFLPVANNTMRKSIQMYQSFFSPAHSFQQTILTTFDSMDHANAWELDNCRFKREGDTIKISTLPRYGRFDYLAQRSLGHILGPLTVATLCDVSSESFRHIEKGLQHYLIARQLSDDIHDWKEDIEAGHASSVVTSILNHLHIPPDSYPVSSLLEEMQTAFWEDSMEATNATIHRQLNLSRRHLLKSGVVKKNGEIFALHQRLKDSATQSTREHANYQTFLFAYSAPQDK
jgi:hypothetical protein